jgi:hypothetical protein
MLRKCVFRRRGMTITKKLRKEGSFLYNMEQKNTGKQLDSEIQKPKYYPPRTV